MIIRENKLLMIKTNKGDFKFPGGRVKREEDNTQALIREVKEESGYTVTNIIKFIGKVIDRNIDKLDDYSIFEMDSLYYLKKLQIE